MSQINKIQIDVNREDYFLQEIQALGCKKFFQKIYYILATAKLGDSFAEVACPFFMYRCNIRIFQLLGNVPVCKQFLKVIDRGFTIEESHIFNNLIDISS